MTEPVERDHVTGQATTGHTWDGIKELNTPLPSWWLYVFYATIVFSVGYWVVYPSWPGLTGYFHGLAGQSARGQLVDQMAEAARMRGPWIARISGQPTASVATDPELLTYAIAGGRAIFATDCAPCHGAGGQGAPGFPVLADDDWIWGGDIANIERTLRYGVRSTHPDARQAEMPRFVADRLLTPAQAADVAAHVQSLAGESHDAGAAARGATVFAEQCAACHGDGGRGDMELGAPNLTDGIWLYGGASADIVAQISRPRHGVMPAWEGRLDDASLKMLSVYIHSLGGGQ
jgi:cytochrome c oxidase cbb3-type subunit 3